VNARFASTVVAVLVIAFAATTIALAMRRSDRSCVAAGGGEPGAQAQLRYVDIAPRQITFTFGPSSESNVFGVPAFDLDRANATVPPELDTGTRRLSIHFAGASGFNPDLTPSYRGKSVLVPQTRGPLREADVTLDSGRKLGWDIVVASDDCPTVTTNQYVWGKSPRAQVTLTFGQASWITAEHPATYVGSPVLAPILVTGMGFAPRSEISLNIAGARVDAATADDAGRVEASIFVPKLQPGLYELTVIDSAGHRATTTLVVTDEL
jgi:hypothetical protein